MKILNPVVISLFNQQFTWLQCSCLHKYRVMSPRRADLLTKKRKRSQFAWSFHIYPNASPSIHLLARLFQAWFWPNHILLFNNIKIRCLETKILMPEDFIPISKLRWGNLMRPYGMRLMAFIAVIVQTVRLYNVNCLQWCIVTFFWSKVIE